MLSPTSRRLLHGRHRQQQQQHHLHHRRHVWISAFTTAASLVVAASFQAQQTTTSLALAASVRSSNTPALSSFRKVDVAMMMVTRRIWTYSDHDCCCDPSTGCWSPLSKRRRMQTSTVTTRYGQRNKIHHESSKLKGHQNDDDNHDDAKRYSSSTSSTTPGGDNVSKKDYNKLPRLYVGDCHSSSSLEGKNKNALLFTAKDWQTTALYDLLCQASSSSRADSQQVVQQQQQLTVGATVLLNADQSHYLTTVMRLGKKKKHAATNNNNPAAPLVRIFDEPGGEWLAEVGDEPILLSIDDNKKKKKHHEQQVISVTCLQQLRPGRQQQQNNNRNIRCWMAVALPKKKERSRWLIEKCTELGVAGFILLDTDYSESRDAEATGSKLLSYAMEAAEQSERLDLPSFVTLLDASSKENCNLSPEHQQQRGSNYAAGNGVGTTALSTLLHAWLWDHASDKNGDDESGGSLSSQQPPPDKPALLACRERMDHSVNVVKVIREQMLNPQMPSSSKEPIVATFESKQQKQHPQITLFLVGPEGGWSPTEQARFDELAQQQHQSNAVCAADDDDDDATSAKRKRSFMWNVSLGPNTLRAETAAVTAAAAHALVLDESFDCSE